jgi:beta-glucosidase
VRATYWKISFVFICLAVGMTAAAVSQTPAGPSSAGSGVGQPLWLDPSQPLEKRVDALVSSMTLEEKVSQMQSHAAAIPRLHIPEYDYWTEGLHGVAYSGYATLFPQMIGMSASWDASLIHDVGEIVSTEARSKYEQAVLDHKFNALYGVTIFAPNINIFRDPRWGRGQETFGEDPFLTSRLGVAYVTGLQGNDAKYLRNVATPKHYAVHSGPEPERHKINVNVSPHDLEDTYLPAFRAAVMEGHAESVMCSYNAIDGIPACANAMILQQHLRKEWGFTGYVTSDCSAITDFFSSIDGKGGHNYSPDVAHASASAVKGGDDMSCGDEFASLVKAVHEGLIAENDITTAVKRILTSRFKLGMFDPPADVKFAQTPISDNNTPEHRAATLKAAEESIVLLKNDGTLPLKPNVHRIAVIGPNAATLAALEGEYNAIPSAPVLPVDGIEDALRGKATVIYRQGAPYVEDRGVTVPRTLFHPAKDSAEFGLKGEYFADAHLNGSPVMARVDKQLDFDWDAASPATGMSPKDFGVRWTGYISFPVAGKYHFYLNQGECDPCREHESYQVWIDGQPIYAAGNMPGAPKNSAKGGFYVSVGDTSEHPIRIDYGHYAPIDGAGITLEWLPPVDVLREEAVRAAQDSDLVLAFVGITRNFESEGLDRSSIELPKVQQQMLQAVAATGKPVVVIVMSGSAVAVNWSKDQASAILEAWYPGETGGTAIANVLTGAYDPAGRLPVTIYRSDSQLAPLSDYSMKNRTYRYFAGDPLYAFGYGLSYTKFRYSGLKLAKQSIRAGEPISVEAVVSNVGDCAGDEVAELYLTPPQSPDSPRRALEGFYRVHLEPGVSTVVHFALRPRDLSEVNSAGTRLILSGVYTISVGGGQPDTKGAAVEARFKITGEKELPE